MNNQFLTLGQTAEYTNLPLHYIYRLSSQNQLPGKVVWGRRTVRVNKETLDNWLNEKTLGQIDQI